MHLIKHTMHGLKLGKKLIHFEEPLRQLYQYTQYLFALCIFFHFGLLYQYHPSNSKGSFYRFLFTLCCTKKITTFHLSKQNILFEKCVKNFHKKNLVEYSCWSTQAINSAYKQIRVVPLSQTVIEFINQAFFRSIIFWGVGIM